MRFRALFATFPLVVACGARTELPDFNETVPQIHVTVPPPNSTSDCPDPTQTLVYAIAESNALYSVYPPTFALTRIGTIDCPAERGASPFSMAVDREGIADVVFDDGELFRVSTADASCQAAPFAPNQDGFLTFGMGFASDADASTETLYISADTQEGSSAVGLASVDANFLVHRIGPLPSVVGAELTGTGGGQLFGFYSHTDNMGPTYIGEIDKARAVVISETAMPGVVQGTAWAFAFWGGDFYIFTSPDGAGSTVSRYRTADGSLTTITTLDDLIVGAGVSTCAPEQ